MGGSVSDDFYLMIQKDFLSVVKDIMILYSQIVFVLSLFFFENLKIDLLENLKVGRG